MTNVGESSENISSYYELPLEFVPTTSISIFLLNTRFEIQNTKVNYFYLNY